MLRPESEEGSGRIGSASIRPDVIEFMPSAFAPAGCLNACAPRSEPTDSVYGTDEPPLGAAGGLETATLIVLAL